MKLLSVGLTGISQDITIRLQQDCCSLMHEGFRIAIDEMNRGKYTFIGCNIVEGELSFRNYERVKDSLKNYVAKIVADFILANEEKTIIQRLIERNYHYFSKEEQKIIYDNSLKLLNDSSCCVIQDFSAGSRRKRIISRLMEYLDHHHELVVDGFVQFRLKDYRDNLAQIVDKAVDELMLDLEYQEFIRVLRYFINVQEPQVEETHVIIQGTSSFKLLDENGQSIDNQYLDSFDAHYSDEINYQDLLITALIAVSPHHVVLHNPYLPATNELIRTIKSIFEDRVMHCSGCELCKSKSVSQNIDSE
ncbi:putative sporulation protein YtxC [Anaerospora hongkongensis]|uniref:putative sporulation protein YtxC n=1 Tax=Anaerospora hongkongensis TaxID=244830 RepID=UPI002FD891E1